MSDAQRYFSASSAAESSSPFVMSMARSTFLFDSMPERTQLPDCE